MKKKSFLKQFLTGIARIQIKHPVLILFLVLGLTALFAIPAQDVRTVASLEQMMPADTPAIESFNHLRDQELGRDAIAILIRIDTQTTHTRTDIQTQDVQEYIVRIQEQLLAETSIHQVITPEQNPLLIHPDRTEKLVIAYSDAAGDDERMKRLAERIEEYTQQGVPAGTRVYLTGTPTIQQKLGEYIQSDQQRTRIASTLFVLLITAIIFGMSSSILPIITVTLSVSWLYGTMGIADLPISTLAGGVAAMVIGIGIDFAIHLMNKYEFEKLQGKNQEEAITEAITHTGTALSVTALTTGAAFLAFIAGVMPEMGRFGILMAMGIVYALILTVFALPALLIIKEHIEAYAKKIQEKQE